MKEALTVVLCGSSLLMACVEAGLQQQQDLLLQRIDLASPDAEAQLNALRPDVIIFDWSDDPAQSPLCLLKERSGLPCIGLDAATNRAIVFSSQQRIAPTIHALAEVIQLVAATP